MGTARPPAPTPPPDDPFDLPLPASGLPGASVLKRVGPRIGLRTVRDLLLWLPRRYDDLRVLHELQALHFVAPDTMVRARASVVATGRPSSSSSVTIRTTRCGQSSPSANISTMCSSVYAAAP